MAFNGKVWESDHEGKMEFIKSISTSSATNPHCIERRKNNESVCAHCYAETYLKMRPSLRNRLEENSKILSTELLKEEGLPTINALIYRFESFGDLINSTHLKNFIRIAKYNSGTKFALWTKNLWILDEVFNKEKVSKPKNLTIVVSSPLVNRTMELDLNKYWMISHVFTVYDKEFAKEHKIGINCGARNCFKCQKCYRSYNNFYINEILK